MSGRFSCLIAWLSFVGASALGAQRAATEPACFHMVYRADSADSPFPHNFARSASDSIAHFWWDSLTPNARELRKQTLGRAKWTRAHGDSVSLRLWSFESGSSGYLRFGPERAPQGGIVAWLGEGGGPIERYQFTLRRIECAHLDLPANDR